MDYSNRKWVIVNVSDITEEMIYNAIQSSMDTLRKIKLIHLWIHFQA